MTCRYHINFIQKDNEIIVYINDKLREYPSMKGVLTLQENITADLCMQHINPLLKEVKKYDNIEKVAAVTDYWYHNILPEVLKNENNSI